MLWNKKEDDSLKRILSLIMALCLLFCMVLPAMAMENSTVSAAVMDSGELTGTPAETDTIPLEPLTPTASPSEIPDTSLFSDFTEGGTEFYTKIRLTVTDRSGTPIVGAVYGLYRSDGTLVQELVTDEYGIATSEDVSVTTDYYVQEISTPEGFLPNEGQHEIKLTDVCAPSRIDVGVEYDPIMGRIKVIKTNEEGDPIPGVVFDVYQNSTWEWKCGITTDEGGIAITPDLPYGAYQLVESSAPEDYATGGTYGISINYHDETAEYPIVNYRSKGDVKITKTGNDGKMIAGTVFEIFSADTDTLVQEVTTGSGGYVWSSYLPLGNYYAVEKSVPAPYKLDTTRHDFSLTYHYQSVYLNIENVVEGDPGKVKIIKTDDSDNPLSGVAFDLFRVWDSKKLSTLTTDASGLAESADLIPDDYYLVETTGVPGYTMESGQIPFTIDGTGATVEKVVVNPKVRIFGAVQLTKKDDAGNPIPGVKFGVYCAKDNLLEELVTDENGTATSGVLNAGDYYLLELEAPQGYQLNTEKHPFTISENGVTVPVSVINQRITGSVKVIKTGDDGETLHGVKFGIYSALTDAEIETITTDWNGIAQSGALYYGDYYLKELETADGYELIDKPIPFSISEQGVTLEIPVTNPFILGGVQIYKVSGDEPEPQSERAWMGEESVFLPGAVFGIYNWQGHKLAEIITDENGCASYDNLPKGSYYLKELTAPEGHILVDRLIPFSIENQGDVFETTIYNPTGVGSVAVRKSGEDGVLSGVEFDVYRTTNEEKVGALLTDESGLATLELPLGRYYLVETATAPGYTLLPGRVSFTLTAAGETVELPLLNQKEGETCDKGQVKVLKRDAGSDTLLPGASFAICRVSDDSKVAEVVTGTDGTGMSQAIPTNDYYLLELRAPNGFEVSTEKYPVTITAGSTTEIIITNKRLPEPKPDEKTGTVKILKVDTADGKTPLSNAAFTVYETVGGKKVGELLTDKNGTAVLTLPAGDYSIRETQAPEGYRLSSDTISLSLKAGETHELTVKNSKTDSPVTPEQPAKPGMLKIIKVDSENGKKLADAVFGVYNADTDKQLDTLTTDKNGVASLSLPAGDYYIREQEAPKGYDLKKTDINFHLESGATRELTVKNTREDEPEKMGVLEITKEDKDTGKALRNAVFAIYDKEDEKIDELTTGRDGIAELELPVGSYYLREVEAPKGYQLDRKKVTFKITEDKTTKITVENVKEVTEPVGTMELVKSAAGSGKRLAGAVFGVYENTGDKKLFEITTDENGLATLELPVGSYSLKELRAPSGYRVETARILFDIRKDGKTIVEVTNELEGAPTKPEQPTTPAQPTAPTTPTAPNQPVISIPQTGEPFPTLYYALAALLLTVAAVCTAGAIRQYKPKHQ